MLSEVPARETLAHSVQIDATSVPMAAGEEQLGQQVVMKVSKMTSQCQYDKASFGVVNLLPTPTNSPSWRPSG